METVSLTDHLVSKLPPGVSETLQMNPQLFIAGGFIRAVLTNEDIKDVDVFTTDLSVVESAVAFLIRQIDHEGYRIIEKKTQNTITVEIDGFPVQFVNNIAYASPLDCLDKFDFTICQAAMWSSDMEWHYHCYPAFLRDTMKKQLVYTAPERIEAPGGSLWRATKFLHRGYSITQEEYAKLVVRLMQGIYRKPDSETYYDYSEEDREVVPIQPIPIVPSVDTVRGYFSKADGITY